jgi:hypothetical protein
MKKPKKPGVGAGQVEDFRRPVAYISTPVGLLLSGKTRGRPTTKAPPPIPTKAAAPKPKQRPASPAALAKISANYQAALAALANQAAKAKPRKG